MVLQQYVDGQDTGAPSLAQLNAELALGKEGAGPSVEASSVLARSVKAARRLAEQSKSFPVGTVLLARGGELLAEADKSERGTLLPRDGQVLDLLSYPALRPIPSIAQESSASAESAPREDMDGLNIRDIELEGTSAIAADGPAGAPKASEPETARGSSLPTPDFVSAYQRHRARAPSRYVHLVVLQHGFLGQAYDMHLIENAIRLDFPGTVEVSATQHFVASVTEIVLLMTHWMKLLCRRLLPGPMRARSTTASRRWASASPLKSSSTAKVRKDRTVNIAFASQMRCKMFFVTPFAPEYHPDLLKPGSKPRISFIGHSMGGLMIRQALHVSHRNDRNACFSSRHFVRSHRSHAFLSR
jgi:hypothetical protein